MTEDPLYQKLKTQLRQVAVVSPQTVGPLTSFYKITTSWVKTWPAKVLIPVAFIGGILFQLLLGEKIVQAVSILQRGF